MASSAASTPSTTPSPIIRPNGDQSYARDGHQEPGDEAQGEECSRVRRETGYPTQVPHRQGQDLP